jgi:hypothetical protein
LKRRVLARDHLRQICGGGGADDAESRNPQKETEQATLRHGRI